MFYRLKALIPRLVSLSYHWLVKKMIVIGEITSWYPDYYHTSYSIIDVKQKKKKLTMIYIYILYQHYSTIIKYIPCVCIHIYIHNIYIYIIYIYLNYTYKHIYIYTCIHIWFMVIHPWDSLNGCLHGCRWPRPRRNKGWTTTASPRRWLAVVKPWELAMPNAWNTWVLMVISWDLMAI
jgi:hypothetical protein